MGIIHSCIYNRRATIKYFEPYSTYKVLALKTFVNSLSEHNHIRNIMLNYVPVCCNYNTSDFLCGCNRRVSEIRLLHVPTTLSLKEHFELEGLDNGCEVGVDIKIYNMVQRVSERSGYLSVLPSA